ncbi:MAG: nuclear transport factor 2 family protein [Candidatus Zixiibacteriota bacterium]|nr:MAG: nuclear transport factor 2 family protein [candidate division Zixibacteria bacterium]
MRYFVPFVFCVIGLAVTIGCANMTVTIDREAEIAAVEQAINTSIKWCLPDKDREKLYAHVAKDSSFFIFHPDSKSTIVGYESFRQFAETIFFDPRFKAVSSEVKDLRVNLSDDGNVAWFSCLLDDYGEWDGNPIGWTNARWTGVLEKREGTWFLVQQHFSLASDAEEQSGDADSGNNNP